MTHNMFDNNNIIEGEVTEVNSNNEMSPEEAKASVLEFIQTMVNLKAQAEQHKPILKSLEELGVTVETRDIEINGEKKKCIVIPVGDLLIKEYELMTGFNASTYMGNAMNKRPAERYNYDNIQNGGA